MDKVLEHSIFVSKTKKKKFIYLSTSHQEDTGTNDSVAEPWLRNTAVHKHQSTFYK
jgi:hypothetical protein